MRALALVIVLLVGTQLAAQTSPLRSLVTDYEAASWKAVGRLDFGQNAFCSGTLIAPDLVLTAAHCLYRPETEQLWPTDAIRFRAGVRAGQAVAERGARSVVAHEKFDPATGLTAENVAHDVGLIRLDAPISTFEVPPFAVAPDATIHGPVSIVSYGRGRAEAQSRQSRCEVLHRVGSAMIFDCDVTHGSSGAPVFSEGQGRRQVLSVVSGRIEVEGQIRSVGMALPARVAEVKAQMGMQRSVPTARVRRLTVGQDTGRSGTGAKFVKP